MGAPKNAEHHNMVKDAPNRSMYDPLLLNGLDWPSVKNYLSPCITNEDPGETWLKIRPLHLDDYNNGFLTLLNQLTTVGNVTWEAFEERFRKMQGSSSYFVTVIEDVRNGSIIASATLATELKFIHDAGLRGKLEDVVVNNSYRGKQLGKLIVLTVTLLAKKLGCYKMSLDCKDGLIAFYKSLGYKLEEGNANSMVIRYEGSRSKL